MLHRNASGSNLNARGCTELVDIGYTLIARMTHIETPFVLLKKEIGAQPGLFVVSYEHTDRGPDRSVSRVTAVTVLPV